MATNKERWEFTVGVPVETKEGVFGHLRQVILNPGDGRVTALVVRHDGLVGRDFVISVENVEDASDEVIRLNLSEEEVKFQPPLQLGRFVAPSSGMSGYSKDQILFSTRGDSGGTGSTMEKMSEGSVDGNATGGAVIRAGQRVVATDGDVGKVDRVLVDSATKRATHFTVRKGLLLRKDIMVPVEWVTEYQPNVIKLGVDRAALEHLPTYQPDLELQWAVEDALWKDQLLVDGVLSEYPIYVDVKDGVVTLRGCVRTGEQKRHAERAVASVPGIMGVKNLLVADTDVEQAVAEALARDPRTRDLPIKVQSWFGYVHLSGEVPSREARIVAEEVAASVDGVHSVVNMLDVADTPTPWERERLRELATGQPVYADDKIIGHVAKLLVAPRTWRINAIVVRIKPNATQNGQPGENGQSHAGESEAIVVPVEYVERASVRSVYLTLPEEEVRKLPRFNPEDYPSPDEDWQPPHPYRREDIALDVSHDLAAAY